MRSLADLRRYAVSQSLFPATTLQHALETFGFVQADPIRAPARAQDLILRHRVVDYHAGDLERRYPQLPIEEAFFINYGFITRPVYALMHPRGNLTRWPRRRRQLAEAIVEFVTERREAHPRDLDEHFPRKRVTNYWGGTSNASTHMLDHLHYLGLLRVVRRQAGIRVYGPPSSGDEPETADPDAALDALVDVVVRKYAPLPSPSLSKLVLRFRYATPQWQARLKRTLQRAQDRLARHRVDGIDWFWPADESAAAPEHDSVKLLAPFDPIVWDRRRFELCWGWPYRFEAYLPVAKRKLGYYALAVLFRDRVIGWANISARDGTIDAELGYPSGRPPRDRQFRGGLDEELERMRSFLTERVPETSDRQS